MTKQTIEITKGGKFPLADNKWFQRGRANDAKRQRANAAYEALMKGDRPFLIYVASPYGLIDVTISYEMMAERQEAVQRFAVEFANIIPPDIAVQYVPVAFWGGWANGKIFETKFAEMEPHYLALCDELWVLRLAGWKKSHGVTREILKAKSLGMEVRYFNPTYIADQLSAEWTRLIDKKYPKENTND